MAIRFEVSQSGHAPHEVELSGAVVVIGRDPTCDLVLADSKCSRRHAVVEEGPAGLVIRDVGSANGVFVNGRRRDRAPLRAGDTVRLGDVSLRLIGGTEETVVLAPVDLEVGVSALEPTPVPPGAPPRSTPPAEEAPFPDRSPAEEPPGARERPPMLTLLAVLWALCSPAWVGTGILLAAHGGLGTTGAVLSALLGVALGLGSGVMAIGLAAQAGWARRAQIAVATAGLLACPLTFASATILLYMLRPDVRDGFEGGGSGATTGAGAAETTFALSLLGMVALAIALTVGGLLALRGR